MRKSILILLLSVFLVGYALSQSGPNLETGFKPYGSYAGTGMDTVDLMNGNVTFQIPFPAEYPERGTVLQEKMVQILHAKGWQVVPNSTSTTSNWKPKRELMGSTDNLHAAHIRTLEQFTAAGQTFQTVSHNAVVTWDGSTHNLMDVSNGQQLAFEAADGSGWHISLSNPNQYGIPQTGVMTDRNGTQYTIPGYGALCSDTSSGPSFPAGGYAPLLYINSPGGLPDSSSFNCPTSGLVVSAVDANGNIFTMPNNLPWTDTLGKNTSATVPAFYGIGFDAAEILNSNPPGCVGAYSFQGSSTISYPGANGQEQLLICYANFPIQTNFGVSGILEFPTSTTIQESIPLIATIVLPDGGTWTFNYDSYGNPIYIGLPLGGSISYQWQTVAFPVIGVFIPVSRAVQQRTVTDGNGNSYIWKYQWLVSQNNPTAPNGTYTNVVTDPLGNDTVHVFTNLGSFYETSTRTYKGSYTSGQLLRQVDTGYQQTGAGDSRDYGGETFPTVCKPLFIPVEKSTSYRKATTWP